jgi:hypothetical protein
MYHEIFWENNFLHTLYTNCLFLQTVHSQFPIIFQMFYYFLKSSCIKNFPNAEEIWELLQDRSCCNFCPSAKFFSDPKRWKELRYWGQSLDYGRVRNEKFTSLELWTVFVWVNAPCILNIVHNLGDACFCLQISIRIHETSYYKEVCSSNFKVQYLLRADFGAIAGQKHSCREESSWDLVFCPQESKNSPTTQV